MATLPTCTPIVGRLIGPHTSLLLAHSAAEEPPAIGSPEADAVMAGISVDAVCELMLESLSRSVAASDISQSHGHADWPPRLDANPMPNPAAPAGHLSFVRVFRGKQLVIPGSSC